MVCRSLFSDRSGSRASGVEAVREERDALLISRFDALSRARWGGLRSAPCRFRSGWPPLRRVSIRVVQPRRVRGPRADLPACLSSTAAPLRSVAGAEAAVRRGVWHLIGARRHLATRTASSFSPRLSAAMPPGCLVIGLVNIATSAVPPWLICALYIAIDEHADAHS